MPAEPTPPSSRPCVVCNGTRFRHLAFDEGYDWEVCAGCAYVRLTRELSQDDARDIQNDQVAQNYIASYEQKFAKKMARTRRRLAVIRRHISGGAFLDIGSNYGFMTEAAAAAGLDVLGLEINPALADVARARFPGRNFVVGAMEDFDFAGQMFDAAYCSEVIEHVADPRLFLQRIAAVLRPGAFVFLTTPHIREHRRTGYRGMKAPDHKLYFSNANLRRLLAECGFARTHIVFNPLKGLILHTRRDGPA